MQRTSNTNQSGHSPTENRIVLFDRIGTVVSYDLTLEEALWQTMVKPDPASGKVADAAFSGDGRIIGLAVAHNNGCNIMTLDATCGVVSNVFLDLSPGRYPYEKTSTLSPMDRIVDLATGQVSDTYTQISDY